VIETGRLLIRVPRLSDVGALIDYYAENQDHLTPWEPLWPEGFLTEAFWRAQLGRYEEQARSGIALRLLIFERGRSGRLTGTVNFTGIQHGAFEGCHLGYGLAAAAEGRGYMTEALQGAIGHVFAELGLHRVMAAYMPRNVRSARVLARLGFVIEGYARDYLLVSGRWEDHVLTSLINPSWE
jgi:ribosomal-protein-alanine N-acetyltransferase